MEEDQDDRDASHDDVDQQNDGSNRKKNSKSRGPTKWIKHRPGLVRKVEWDSLRRPIGKWSTKLSTHIGVATRAKVSILIDEWTNVPEGLKETLWLDIKKEFEIDEKDKAKVLKKCCLAWTGHKSKLVTGWIECSRPTPKYQPYDEGYYQHITKEVWDEFVKINSTEEAKKKRERARKSQSYNLYPHNLGKKSYAQMTPVWREKGLLPTPSTSSNSSDISAISLASERSIAWLLARSKPDEEGNMYIPNEMTKLVKEKIDDWNKKQEEGEFVPSRLDDALNRALEKKDRNGRPVLGVGSGTTLREAFGTCDRKVIKETDLDEMERRVRQKVREDLKDEVREEVREEMRGELREELKNELTSSMNALFEERFVMLAKQMKLPEHLMVHLEANSPIAPIAPSSCQSGGLNSLASQEVNDYKQPQSCQLALFLHNRKERVIVATGMWYPQMRLDHNKPMSSENVRVSVDKYEQQYRDVLVPVPSSKIKKLHQAHGSFVQWPKELVDLSTNEVIRNENTANKNEVVGAQRKEVANGATSKKVVTGGSQSKKIVSGQDTRGSFTNPKKAFGLDKEFQHLGKKCQIMRGALYGFSPGQIIKMPYDKDTFFCNDDSVCIKREDVLEFLAGDSLGVSCLQVFLMALLDHVDNMCLDSFGFMCPALTSETMISSSMDDCTRYMTRVMQENRTKRFILCPYHQEYHWTLLVLCTSRNEVYVFDSMRPASMKKRVLSIRITLCNAFRGYKLQTGQSSMAPLTWIEANCSQQDGSTECAYFVMRYIFDLVLYHYNSEDLTKVLQRSTPYFDDEINEVRDIWAKYFVANAPI